MENVISSKITLNTPESGITVIGGGFLNIVSPATTVDLTVSSGGYAYIWTGASASETILDGGYLNVYHGFTTDTTVNSGGTLYAGAGAILSATTVNYGGNLEVASGGTASDTTIYEGGILTLDPGASLAGTTLVTSGGEIDITRIGNPHGTTGGYGAIILDSGAKLVIKGRLYPENPITAAPGSEIDFPYLTKITKTITNGNILTITGINTYNETIIYTLNIYNASISNIIINNSGEYIYNACFLAGSMITTPSGPRLIQDICLGDEVVTFINDQRESHSVTWAGQAHCNVRSHLPDDEAGYPVRILKDAINRGVPSKDMLITAEHCLFFEGSFVPARMLVNGCSIFYDKTITSYNYYHIETTQHSIIMADGVLTESYLDTGNRHTFQQKNNLVSFTQPHNLNWSDAAAPLGVSREFVEPLFRQLEIRANKLGYLRQTEMPVLTTQSDLCLVTENGTIIRQIREHDDRIMFMIPPGVNVVHIVSNASRPCDVIGPFVDDRRYFGVAIGEIMMFESNKTHAITTHLAETELKGWNVIACKDERWTSGNAVLPLGERALNSIALMAIRIKGFGPYVLNTTNKKSACMPNTALK